MVLGLRAKTHRSPSVQAHYLIHIHEIKPWPPSQSLRTLKAVLIQWEHGDRNNAGSTNQVVPSLGIGSDGRIEFNESFRLPVILTREISVKGGGGGNVDTFHKNCIHFSLYEPRHDKMAKGQLLGTATVDLAVYGIIKARMSISAPINCKRSYRNTAQPFIFLKIQPVEKVQMRSLLSDGLMREEASLDRNVTESVSTLMSEEYAEEAETASFTDDDLSSHSSLPFTYSAAESNCSSPQKENGSELVKNIPAKEEEQKIENKDEKKARDQPLVSLRMSSSCSQSKDLSSDLAWISRKVETHITIQSATPYKKNTDLKSSHEDQAKGFEVEVINDDNRSHKPSEQSTNISACSTYPADEAYSASHVNIDYNTSLLNSVGNNINAEIDENMLTPCVKLTQEAARTDVDSNGLAVGRNREDHQGIAQELVIVNWVNDEEVIIDEGKGSDDEPVNISLQDDTIKQALEENNAISYCRESLGTKSIAPNNERFKYVKSVRSMGKSNRGNGSPGSNQFVSHNTQSGTGGFTGNGAKFCSMETTDIVLESKIQKLKERVQMLEGELREAAAIEVGLYSVVAEHGSSLNKVHAPARRLSRFYLHACKENSVLRRGSAAKSAISGLILVSKACGNDVPRLTFWLSNCVMLRATLSEFFEKQQFPLYSESIIEKTMFEIKKKSSPPKWLFFPNKSLGSNLHGSYEEWEVPHTFIRELEKVEAWIFSRITFTLHMQPGSAKALSRSMESEISKIYQRTSSSGDEDQGKFSLELWKKAFRDACEKICPVRARGNECGCLHLLSKLIMEQCVARLDVAMFNAILRESADEIPADPVSDPISDARVLPISTGKASFGAGAQMKNVIGNWLRWLTDLFDIDDGCLPEDENNVEDINDRRENGASFKPFHLLNALSDLMMLPKDMLLSSAIRKEVCPMFGPPLIRRVLDAFVPDEFCPDPIPDVVLEDLTSEDHFEVEEETVMNLPYPAAPIQYVPPSAASVTDFFDGVSGLRSIQSSLLNKSCMSDDELDELDSPLSFILTGCTNETVSLANPSSISRGSANRNAVRYQLLREVWTSAE
ncbi:PREDICTED: uncharacterized protein LOC109180610 isoform X2 [Ipomoea nil]|uniref:uncharacterized protein LOC109180610 isoform X2 n=1 Tax=Ipomoea nil TaxID=35883 RepID=UPI0009009B1F|nr:PREDICTED: uncharacterized protein LOC109180610 isoform X2 [Ipomoea nil]